MHSEEKGKTIDVMSDCGSEISLNPGPGLMLLPWILPWIFNAFRVAWLGHSKEAAELWNHSDPLSV